MFASLSPRQCLKRSPERDPHSQCIVGSHSSASPAAWHSLQRPTPPGKKPMMPILNIRPSQVAARSAVCGGWSTDRGWGQSPSARIFNGRQVVWPAEAKLGVVETIGGCGCAGLRDTCRPACPWAWVHVWDHVGRVAWVGLKRAVRVGRSW